MPPSRKPVIKLVVQGIIILLVIAGVVRAVRKAQDDLAQQADRVSMLLDELDRAIAEADTPEEAQRLRAEREQIAAQRLSFRNVNYARLGLAGLIYLAALAPAWLYWHLILRGMGQHPTPYESFRAYYIGHLGKYMPGKALVVILRTSLVCTRRTAAAPAALAVFVETLTTMAAGALVAAVCLAWNAQSQWLVILSLGLMAAAGLPTIPPLFRRIVRLLRVKKLNEELAPYVDKINGRLLLSGWVLGVANWCGMGCCLFTVLWAMPTQTVGLTPFAPGQAVSLEALGKKGFSPGQAVSLEALGKKGFSPGQAVSLEALGWRQLPLLTGAVALAAVAGFLSLLPGGIGVRELVVTEVLTPMYGAVMGVASAVLLRIVWLVCEVLLSAILYGLHRPAADSTTAESAAESPAADSASSPTSSQT